MKDAVRHFAILLLMLTLLAGVSGCGHETNNVDDDVIPPDDDVDDDSLDDDALPPDDDTTPPDDDTVADDDTMPPDDDTVADDDTAPPDDDAVADDDTTLEPPTVKTLSWIHSTDGRLMDEYGRQWLLFGINARVTGLFDGSAAWVSRTAVYDQSDAQGMAHDGFNLFRLPINWSALEPVEGQFSADYLQQMEQVIAWARDAGLYVLIDFHQDKYSKFVDIGDDGAPQWAVYPPPDGKIDVSLQFLLAVNAFFNNVDKIQDRFIPAWQTVVARFADQPNVIGFEVMNEPCTVFLLFGRKKLYSFYENAAHALRELDDRHSIWMEPDVYRNQFLWAPLRAEPFPDDNVVYEPHLYPNFIGMMYLTPEEWVAALTETFDHMVAETNSWGAAAVIGEWGTRPSDDYAPAMFQAVQDLSGARNIGLAFWLWKEAPSNSWGLFDYDDATGAWTPRADPGVDALLRPRVMAAPGSLVSTSFDVDTATLTASFEADGGEGPPLLYLPATYYPHGVVVELDGQPAPIEIDADTQRALAPWSGESGSHELIVRPQ